MTRRFHDPPSIVSRVQDTSRVVSVDRASTMNDHCEDAFKRWYLRSEASSSTQTPQDPRRIEASPRSAHAVSLRWMNLSPALVASHRSLICHRIGGPSRVALRQPMLGRRPCASASRAFQEIKTVSARRLIPNSIHRDINTSIGTSRVWAIRAMPTG